MLADPVPELFDYWVTKCAKPGAKLTRDRRQKVEARIREGYDPERIRRAIDGCAFSSFHRGENDRQRTYNDLTLICRTGSKLEEFEAMAPDTNGGHDRLTKEITV